MITGGFLTGRNNRDVFALESDDLFVFIQLNDDIIFCRGQTGAADSRFTIVVGNQCIIIGAAILYFIIGIRMQQTGIIAQVNSYPQIFNLAIIGISGTFIFNIAHKNRFL